MSKIIINNKFIDNLHQMYCPDCNGRASRTLFKCGYDYSHTKNKAINLLWRRFAEKIVPRAEQCDLGEEGVLRILRTPLERLTPADRALKDFFEISWLELIEKIY